jgi:hypothetical protein
MPYESIAGAPQIYIRSVIDHRNFENKPATANIPSLKGGIEKATDEEKLRAVGIKRNAYGKAMGDYLLAEGQDVCILIQNTLIDAAHSKGINVITDGDGLSEDTIIMDVYINKFWSWFRPGTWVAAIDAEILTVLNITSDWKTLERDVYAKASNKTGMAVYAPVSGQWQGVIQLALNRFREDAADKLAGLTETLLRE